MTKLTHFNILAIGMALFSMFFGAGNVAFPVYVGHITQDMSGYAILGLTITAILVPFLGLMSVAAYDGDYIRFFTRLGKIPGWAIIILIMLLVGPVGAIPRCIAISYSTMLTVYSGIDVFWFSVASAVVIYLFTIRPSSILDVLGKFLTPVLLIALGIIIYEGLHDSPDLMVSHYEPFDAFLTGLRQGYNTMDLFGAFIFAGVVLQGIRQLHKDGNNDEVTNAKHNMIASVIAMVLLAAVYTGMCYVGAHHGQSFAETSPDRLLSQIAVKLLGPYAGLVVCTAVSFACLTTAISLSLVFAQFLNERVTRGRVSYQMSLVITLAIAFGFSLLEFSGLQKFLGPALQVTLPGLILLTILNLVHAWREPRPARVPIKFPVFAVFGMCLFLFCTR